ncbi:hypothetical protein ACFYYL_08815 [Actinomadura geliboluensis]|uniref:hypothetical protein n=1 Tax=Actinomadura geliboluensis TaxID=882440 RepID=UPI0036A379E6
MPWSIPFPLLGDGFEFAFSREIAGDMTLEPEETAPNHPKEGGSRGPGRIDPWAPSLGRQSDL